MTFYEWFKEQDKKEMTKSIVAHCMSFNDIGIIGDENIMMNLIMRLMDEQVDNKVNFVD